MLSFFLPPHYIEGSLVVRIGAYLKLSYVVCRSFAARPRGAARGSFSLHRASLASLAPLLPAPRLSAGCAPSHHNPTLRTVAFGAPLTAVAPLRESPPRAPLFESRRNSGFKSLRARGLPASPKPEKVRAILLPVGNVHSDCRERSEEKKEHSKFFPPFFLQGEKFFIPDKKERTDR